MAVASVTVSNYFDPQVPSSLPQLQHDNNWQRERLNQLFSTWHLRASFEIVLTQMHRYHVKSFLLRVYFENNVKAC